MDMDVVAVVLMALGVVLWLIDRFAERPAKGGDDDVGVLGGVSDIISAASSVAFPNLVFIVGFILLLFDNGWLMVSAGTDAAAGT